jgi:hypothetical protein
MNQWGEIEIKDHHPNLLNEELNLNRSPVV